MDSLKWLPALCLAAACTGSQPDDTSADTDVQRGDPPEAPALVLNEFLGSNDATNADEAGEFDDWVELYNSGDSLIGFDGIYLTDDLDKPTEWPLPAGTGLQPGDYFLIWCDGQPEQGDAHSSFKIEKNAGVLALYIVADGYDPVRIDGINYEQQQPDMAAARVPDGSDNWLAGRTPSPASTNGQ